MDVKTRLPVVLRDQSLKYMIRRY